MNQNLVYFASVVVGAVLSYLINQLPGVPDAVKPWLWIPVIGLTLLSAWLVIKSSQASSESQKTSPTQSQTSFDIDARDNARVNVIDGDINATTVNFGDKRP
jgi:F0F1-type ATP synthase assembly protein I